MSGLIWVQFVCKGHEQTILVGNELAFYQFQKIRDKIEQIRSRELSLDEMDDEASDYILEDKLQKKFVAVWTKLCLLHKQAATTGRPTQKLFRYEGKKIYYHGFS